MSITKGKAPFVIYLFLWFACTVGHPQDGLSPQFPVELKSVIDQAALVPDYSIMFWTHYDAGPDGVRKQQKKFVKKGECWRMDEWEAGGLQIQTFAFDGATYYYHRPTAPYLLITPHPENFILGELAMAYSQNPITCPLEMPFMNPESRAKCRLPGIPSAREIEEALGLYTVEEIEIPADPKRKRFRFEGLRLMWDLTIERDDDDYFRIVEEIFQHKQDPLDPERRPAMMDNGRSVQIVKRRYEKWQTFELDGQRIKIPGSIRMEARNLAEGGAVNNRGSTSFFLIPESVTTPSPALVDDDFRVPPRMVEKPVILTEIIDR